MEATYVRNWAINLLFLWTRWGIAQIGFDRFAPCCLLPVSCNNGGKSRLRAPHRISAAACNTHSLTHTHTHTIASTRTHHLSVECVILYFRCSKFRTTTPRFFLSVDVSRVASPFVFFLLASAHFSFFYIFLFFILHLPCPPIAPLPPQPLLLVQLQQEETLNLVADRLFSTLHFLSPFLNDVVDTTHTIPAIIFISKTPH